MYFCFISKLLFTFENEHWCTWILTWKWVREFDLQDIKHVNKKLFSIKKVWNRGKGKWEMAYYTKVENWKR